MLQAAQDTIDNKFNPMLRAIRKDDWIKADDLWQRDSIFCREIERSKKGCDSCPLFTGGKLCWQQSWFEELDTAIFRNNLIAILYIGDIIEELKQLKEQ